MTTAQPTGPNSASAKSVPALVTFYLLTIWLGMLCGLFLLVWHKVQIDSILFGLLGAAFGTETTLLTASVGFWVGTTSGAKASGDALVESNKTGAAALAQLAGAGPPPPSQPLNLKDQTNDVLPGSPQSDQTPGSPPQTGAGGGKGDSAHFS